MHNIALISLYHLYYLTEVTVDVLIIHCNIVLVFINCNEFENKIEMASK